jgi:hypothetical protein
MPTLFFAREGAAPDRAKSICDIEMSLIMKHFSKLDTKYKENPPIINLKVG